MTIETYTINTKEYNAYVTLMEADKYFCLDIDHSWNSLTEERKSALLVSATRRIDLLRFKSEKSEPDQPLKFPRKAYDLPYDIELATILLANNINIDATQQFVADSNSSIKRVQAGSVEVEFFQTFDIEIKDEENSITDPTIRALLAPYLTTGIPSEDIDIVGCAFGTDEKSHFADINRYYIYDRF